MESYHHVLNQCKILIDVSHSGEHWRCAFIVCIKCDVLSVMYVTLRGLLGM